MFSVSGHGEALVWGVRSRWGNGSRFRGSGFGVFGAKGSTGKRQSKLSVCLGLGFRAYRV